MKYLIAPLLFLGACADDAPGDPCGEPSYAGRATDEAWHVMLDGYDVASVGAAEAVTVTTPAAAAIIPADGPAPTFAWTSPIAGATGRASAPALARSGPERSWLDAVLGFFVGTARAHLPPITSDVYYLEITVPGEACAVRALTTNESWVPDIPTWDAMRAAPGAFTLTITSAYLVENRITEGPYRPSAVTAFEVR